MAWSLFEVFGVEMEYMIVDRETLDVRAVADRLLEAAAGRVTEEFEAGALTWCNELAAHVIELKTTEPVRDLHGLGAVFRADIARIEALLEPMGCRLLPTAMHPWMDPHTEMRLWPYGYGEIYQAFDRIFDCRGHGWANLQSTHLNLPFADDREFGILHAAVRAALPLLPAVAASSPFMDGADTGILDNRLAVYRTNAARIPSVTGRVIPEPVFTEAGYRKEILGRMYEDIAPLDPAGVLQDEWLNARGAIARFDRGSIEIRVLDLQETPEADVGILHQVVALVKRLAARAEEAARLPQDVLVRTYEEAVRLGPGAVVADGAYLELLGLPTTAPAPLGAVWRHLYAPSGDRPADTAFERILDRGPVAARLRRAAAARPDRAGLRALYRRLADNPDSV